jgi:hypothetical protein
MILEDKLLAVALAGFALCGAGHLMELEPLSVG